MRLTYFWLSVRIIECALFTSGPLEGVSCDSEAVQTANSAQLHSILSELADATFFRLVKIDGEGICPIESLRPGRERDEPTCGNVVDTFASFVPPSSGFGGATLDGTRQTGESLCSIEPEESPLQQAAETVVTSMSEEEVYAQMEFPRDNECMIEGTFQIRPDYWLDICNTTTMGKPEYVNLQLNPERNTGYNGSLVWAEMHQVTNKLTSFEGHVLNRILSGYHMSVTTQVMWSYYPPGKDQTRWRPNAKKFATQNFIPDRIKDMQFAFVLIARSMYKIREFLYSYNYTTGNATADTSTRELMTHFLDSSVLSSCDKIFSAFDESVMFGGSGGSEVTEFKKAFRQLSRLVNCVTCHRCKLHASVAMHGIGVALKILLTRDISLVIASLSRDDIVSLVNTIHKFSESIVLANELMALHASRPGGSSPSKSPSSPERLNNTTRSSVDRELSFISSIPLTRIEEDALVDALVRRDENVLKIAEFFSGWKFVRHSLIYLGIRVPDAVVVGGGLAGLVTAISVADRGGSVIIVEKHSTLGGNSAKASSGINSVNQTMADTQLFYTDTVKSQNGIGDPELAKILVDRSNTSVTWLEEISGVKLDAIGQLGGHSVPRTHRPENGVVGAELMGGLISAVKNRWPRIRVVTGARVTKLLMKNNDQIVEGIEYIVGEKSFVQYGRSIVLASGGFGYDTEGLVRSYRPDLIGFPTTLGSHTTGDGIRLAASVGAQLMDMEYIQLHPTGFVDIRNRAEKTKVLAAEILRGIGGVLLRQNGGRFVNELATRKFVTDEMLKTGDLEFWIILSDKSVSLEERLTTVYENRGLLRRVTSRDELETIIGTDGILSLSEYSDTSRDDKFGRKDRQGLPLDEGEFWLVGLVTPVIHYTMGGVKVDVSGRVVGVDHLFAVGEVTGGVHGENRLGGNSLLECTVFGRIIGGESIPINQELVSSHFETVVAMRSGEKSGSNFDNKHKKISIDQVKTHATEDDCWTVIDGKVYDLSRYANEHPGGVSAIAESCGKDSTKRFLVAHSINLLDDMDFRPIGISVY